MKDLNRLKVVLVEQKKTVKTRIKIQETLKL